MSNPDVIQSGSVAQFHYTLRDGAKEVIDSSEGREPLTYLHGASNIVPGLERQMEGKAVGDKFTANVPAAEGYGERTGEGPQPVPRSALPEDAPLQPGMMLQAQSPEGQVVPVWITKVEETQIFVDDNHPLAGVDLSFEIELVNIREATDEERSHGHPHGPGGHHH